MRACAVAAIAVWAASSAAVSAADVYGGGPPAGYSPYAYSPRIEPLIVWDYQPGVIVRTYWWSPWQNRHYFPKTGKRPKVGRLEHVTARKRLHRKTSIALGRSRLCLHRNFRRPPISISICSLTRNLTCSLPHDLTRDLMRGLMSNLTSNLSRLIPRPRSPSRSSSPLLLVTCSAVGGLQRKARARRR